MLQSPQYFVCVQVKTYKINEQSRQDIFGHRGIEITDRSAKKMSSIYRAFKIYQNVNLLV